MRLPEADWTEPGAHPVSPGIYRIPLPLPGDGLRAVNVYAIADGDHLVLVDSGWALTEARAALEKALAEIGAQVGDVRQFLVTHVHRDHYTQAVALRREFGGRIYLGAGERESLSAAIRGDGTPVTNRALRLAEAGAEPVLDALSRTVGESAGDRNTWEEPDEWIHASAEISLDARSLRALPTPGHTRGHLVFVEERTGLLFAGDHVLPHITPSIGFEPISENFPLRDYLDSLRLVRALPDMRLLPAHGPMGESVHERVDELLQHHATRLSDTYRAVERGAATVYAAAKLLNWTRHERSLDELDPFNQMLAVMETHAHLELLALQGRLGRERFDGLLTYAPA